MSSIRSEDFVVKVIGSNIGSSGKTDGEIAKSTANITKEYWNRGDGLHSSILFEFIYLKEDRERGIEKESITEYNFLPLRSSSFLVKPYKPSYKSTVWDFWWSVSSQASWGTILGISYSRGDILP